MIVYPLSQGSVASEHQCDDVTSAGLVGVLLQRTFEPPHFERTCEGVDLESPDRAGDAGGDGGNAEHVVVCCVCILSGEQQICDAVNDFAILHHGVTQPVFHPSV